MTNTNKFCLRANKSAEVFCIIKVSIDKGAVKKRLSFLYNASSHVKQRQSPGRNWRGLGGNIPPSGIVKGRALDRSVRLRLTTRRVSAARVIVNSKPFSPNADLTQTPKKALKRGMGRKTRVFLPISKGDSRASKVIVKLKEHNKRRICFFTAPFNKKIKKALDKSTLLWYYIIRHTTGVVYKTNRR